MWNPQPDYPEPHALTRRRVAVRENPLTALLPTMPPVRVREDYHVADIAGLVGYDFARRAASTSFSIWSVERCHPSTGSENIERCGPQEER